MSKSSRRKPASGGSAQQRPAQPARHPRQRPDKAAEAAPTYSSPLARRIAANSMPALIWLHGRPRWFLLVVVALLLFGGLAIPGLIGALLLIVLATFLAWLLLLSWPVMEAGGRLTRLVLVALVFGAAVVKILS